MNVCLELNNYTYQTTITSNVFIKASVSHHRRLYQRRHRHHTHHTNVKVIYLTFHISHKMEFQILFEVL